MHLVSGLFKAKLGSVKALAYQLEHRCIHSVDLDFESPQESFATVLTCEARLNALAVADHRPEKADDKVLIAHFVYMGKGIARGLDHRETG